jgi:hypothetical protein
MTNDAMKEPEPQITAETANPCETLTEADPTERKYECDNGEEQRLTIEPAADSDLPMTTETGHSLDRVIRKDGNKG